MYYIFIETFRICEWDGPSTRNFFVSRLTNTLPSFNSLLNYFKEVETNFIPIQLSFFNKTLYKI